MKIVSLARKGENEIVWLVFGVISPIACFQMGSQWKIIARKIDGEFYFRFTASADWINVAKARSAYFIFRSIFLLNDFLPSKRRRLFPLFPTKLQKK